MSRLPVTRQSLRSLRSPLVAAALVLGAIVLGAGCAPATLDSFLYAAKKAPAGGYDLSTAVIPKFQDLTVDTPDGEKLDAIYVPSKGAHADITLIYCHGQATTIGDAWPRIELLYDLGYNLEVFDYRGFGNSTGSPTEPGLVIDEHAIRSELLARTGADPARLVYYGRSLGGGTCIDLASTAPPGVLITESAFTSVAALVADGSSVDFPVGLVSDSRWDNLSKIAHIATPYMAMHGDADDYVEPIYAVQLTDAHRPVGVTQLIMVPGADHSDVPDKFPSYDAYRAAIAGFVGDALKE